MAVKNASSNAKTVKEMLNAFPNDTWSIDKVLTYGIYDSGSAIMEVQIGNILDKYRSYLEYSGNDYTDTIDVPEEYYYMPSSFANYFYGDPQLDFLVLYFAKIPTAMEFNKPKITVLKYSALDMLNRLLAKENADVVYTKSNPEVFSSTKLS
jgi:hypothetical protein